MKPLGVYIHVPFCRRKCLYCDFISYASREQDLPAYFETLCEEVQWYVRAGLMEEYQPCTLYIGGGTPSIAVGEVVSFLAAYAERLSLNSLREATIEVNPGTVMASQLRQLRQTGLTRVSIGVQSFHEQGLQTLGRIHTREDGLTCVREARKSGFETISLDLMFGIPGSDLNTWKSSLHEAIDLQPEHISIYNLTVEEGTPFWEQQQLGQLPLPTEEIQLEMYDVGRQMLADAGYDQYEISNFALPGHQCQHNCIYWRNDEYLGLGAGAFSYLNGCRYWNVADLDLYMWQNTGAALSHRNGDAPYPPSVKGEECLDLSHKVGETAIMNLRMRDGIDLAAFHQRFGLAVEEVYAEPIQHLTSLGLLEIQGDHLRLTQQGILVSNEVFQEFLA